MNNKSPNQNTTSEWVGLRGRIGARYLNSVFRRISEVLFLGDLRRRLLQRLPELLKGNDVVLDIGAGSGYFSIPIAERLKGGKIICIDLSSTMLAELKRKAKKRGVYEKIEPRLGNAYKLEVDDSSVDLATSNGVFHELAEPEKVLVEIERVLKPGGFVVISDFRDTSLGKRIAARHRKEAHGPFSPEEFKAILGKAGFITVEVDVVRHWVLAVGQKGS